MGTEALPSRYGIERELGRGGMAVVYLAHDHQHDRPVAIKVLRPELAMGDSGERFLREIRLAARLQHPLIVGLLDAGTTDELPPRPFYVMPFIDGQSLRERLTRDGQLPVDEAVRLTREIGDALGAAHRAGIVHRDVKPENVLIAAGHAMVTDFGIAHAVRSSGGDSLVRLTRSGMSLGTPAYMSPEQAAGDEIDARSDQYSLACVLFELLTGRPPFVAPTAATTIAQHIVAPPPLLTALRPSLPAGIVSAVDRALSKVPVERFETMDRFCEALTDTPVPIEPRDRSLVVLPFANLSADPDNEYFADGLTEEVISDLSGLRNLRVISRSSAMRYKGTAKSVQEIGRELGVGYSVEGSVRRAAASLRITVQLVNVATNATRWSGKFSGTTDDVFALQERIAREIASALEITLSATEDRRLSERPIRNARAFDLFLQARALLWRFDAVSRGRASALLDEAIALEGDNAALAAMQGYSLAMGLFVGESMSEATRAQARMYAEHAISLAPESADAYCVAGAVALDTGDLQQCYDSMKQCLARQPGHPEASAWISNACLHAGRLEAVLTWTAMLRSVDPLHVWGWVLPAFAHLFSGRFGDALAPMQHAIELQPDGLFPRWQSGYANLLAGNISIAAMTAERLDRVDAGSPYSIQFRALLDAAEGRPGDARARLVPLDNRMFDSHTTFHLAEAYAAAGDAPMALQLLSRAIETGFFCFPFIAEHCPFFDTLRQEPGFAPVLAEARRRSDAFVV